MFLTTQSPREGGIGPGLSIRHWLGLPVRPLTEGTFDDVLAVLPHFGRQPFAMPSMNGDEIGVNSYLDTIYRLPTRHCDKPIPVGVVSKNYRLVDHHSVLRTVEQSLANRHLDLTEIRVAGEWTVHGERAHFSIMFPPEEHFTVGTREDKSEMRFRIEVFNSVDGSCRLMAVAGWLRFVCSNGLIIGTALMQLQQEHRRQLEIEELSKLVGEGITSAQTDKKTFERWMSTQVHDGIIVPWIDEEVRALWGVKAAVRVLGIIRHGWDVEPVGGLGNRKPSEVVTRRMNTVPGVDAPVTDLLGVSQVLSWTAGQRGEISEDFKWRSQVHDLVAKLDLQTH